MGASGRLFVRSSQQRGDSFSSLSAQGLKCDTSDATAFKLPTYFWVHPKDPGTCFHVLMVKNQLRAQRHKEWHPFVLWFLLRINERAHPNWSFWDPPKVSPIDTHTHTHLLEWQQKGGISFRMAKSVMMHNGKVKSRSTVLFTRTPWTAFKALNQPNLFGGTKTVLVGKVISECSYTKVISLGFHHHT